MERKTITAEKQTEQRETEFRVKKESSPEALLHHSHRPECLQAPGEAQRVEGLVGRQRNHSLQTLKKVLITIAGKRSPYIVPFHDRSLVADGCSLWFDKADDRDAATMGGRIV